MAKFIETYPDDQPFPSKLVLGFVDGRPIHCVVSYTGNTVHVVTAYEPTEARWEDGFVKRKRK